MTQLSPRLYLILPPIIEATPFKPLLQSALAAGDVACVLLRQSGNGDPKQIAQSLLPMVQDRDAAFLVEGDPRLAARIGADGVHVAYSEDALESALGSAGPERIVGVGALAGRDDAMSAGEAGASYVMFGEPDSGGTRPRAEDTLERVAWWASIFNVPCVGYADTRAEIEALAATGTEFVAVGGFVWEHPGGPAAAVKEASVILASAVVTS